MGYVVVITLAIIAAVACALVNDVGESKRRKWEDEKSGYDADQ